MDTFAALALATDPASPASLKRKPDRKHAPLISVDMWKMIVTQAIYQIVVCLVLHFRGAEILSLDMSEAKRAGSEADLKTLVFNCFVFCQIFNQLNCRRLDRRFNILEGFFRNIWFLSIFAIMVGGQCLIVMVGGAAFQVTRLRAIDWAISIVVGFIAIPIGVLVRMVPTAPIERILIKMRLFPDPNDLPTFVEDDDASEISGDGFIYNPALEKVKDNLTTFARIRGGRLRASSLVKGSRHAALRKADIQLPSLLTMVPTLVAGGIGAGHNWVSQVNNLALANPAAQDVSRSQVDLYAGRVQLHPDTDPSDPMYAKFGIEPPTGRTPSPSSKT
jgi:Ca2+-transporting ATPase